MADRILREDARQDQKATEKVQDFEPTESAGQGKKQVEYLRSLGKPSERAQAAFRAAGIPLDKLLPEDVVAFEHRPDGSFVLKLARELQIHIGGQALLLGTTISGVLALHEIRNLQGMSSQRTQGNATSSSRIARLTVQNGELVLDQDAGGQKQSRVKTEALGDVKP